MRLRSSCAMLVAIVVWSVAATAQERIGNEFQINTYTSGNQRSPSVAVDANGNFVVVWESYGSDGSDTSAYSIQGQRLDTAGNPIGSQFQVNTYTTSYQYSCSVAVEADGDFVVVWQSYGSSDTDISFSSIQAQRYDASGTRVGDQLQINTYTTSRQSQPAVAIDADSNFVVVWESYGSDGSDTSYRSIQAQRYDASGTRVGDQFQVNTYTNQNQMNSELAVDSQGNFVVVWGSQGSNGSDTSSRSIQAQRFNASGAPAGVQFQVNSYTNHNQKRSELAVDSQGNFVVVWESYGSYGSDNFLGSIQGQRFDSAGNTLGGDFQINTYTTDDQLFPSVAMGADGDFVVVWQSYGSYGSDTDRTSVQGQRYDPAGSPIGDQFQVNTYTTSYQFLSSVAIEADGDFIVAWDSYGSYGSDTSDSSIQGQRFGGPAVVFVDGFESGDFSGWDSVVPPPVP